MPDNTPTYGICTARDIKNKCPNDDKFTLQHLPSIALL